MTPYKPSLYQKIRTFPNYSNMEWSSMIEFKVAERAEENYVSRWKFSMWKKLVLAISEPLTSRPYIEKFGVFLQLIKLKIQYLKENGILFQKVKLKFSYKPSEYRKIRTFSK